MYRVKNLLETTVGRYLIAAFVVIVIFIVMLIVSLVFNNNEEAVQGEQNKQETIESDDNGKEETLDSSVKATLYSGTWYSNRDDAAVLELNEDETFSSSAWLIEGTFSIEEGVLVLEDSAKGTISLELHTRSGETVLYDPVDGFYFYSSQEQLEEESMVQQGFSELEANLEQQKWIDVLEQGTWEYSINDIDYSMVFSDNSFTIQNVYEGKETTATFDYYLEDIEITEEGATLTIQKKREDTGSSYFSTTFEIKETSRKYVLTASIGSFLWNNTYEKPISDVELTQNGTTEAEKSQLQSISVDEDGNRMVVKERVLE